MRDCVDDFAALNRGFETLGLFRDARNPAVARLRFSRPAARNAITGETPGEIAAAVAAAEADESVRCIVVEGEGKSFCAGYDLKIFGESREHHPCQQERHPWDPLEDYAFMHACTEGFMRLWHARKPTIARVQGHAVAGGSDIANCCDLVVIAEDAKMGYMPTRVWGCPTTAMWVYKLGPERAKRLMLTGDLIDGRQAVDWGLASETAPVAALDEAVDALADRVASVPASHLMMQKLVINNAIEAMGLRQTQSMATLLDGVSRHNPEGLWFRRHAQVHGFKAAVEWRDSGRPIPGGDAARARIAELEAELARRDAERE